MTKTITPINPEDPASPKQPELHILDIIASRDFIKMAIERGTYTTIEEQKTSHFLFDRLEAFADYAQAVEMYSQQQAAALNQTVSSDPAVQNVESTKKVTTKKKTTTAKAKVTKKVAAKSAAKTSGKKVIAKASTKSKK